MLKKLLSLMLTLCILLSLSACGNTPTPSVGGVAEQTTPTQLPTTNPTEGTPSAGATTPQTTEPTVLPTNPTPQPEVETVPPATEPTPTQPEATEPAPSLPPTLEPDPAPTYGHTPLPASEYYHYSQMSATEKQIYAVLVSAIKNLQGEVSLRSYDIKADAALKLFQRVLADNPQLFWVSRSSSVVYDSRTQKVDTFILQFTDGEKVDGVSSHNKPIVLADRNKIAAKRQTLEDKIAQILSTIPANISQVEREKRIHDYILANVRYDYATAANATVVNGFLPHPFDIYGAAIEGISVCEGYAKLFQYLCYRTGISATQMIGTANGGDHMWNCVQLDGAWYEIDVTWADTDSGIPYYGYFNLTHQQMSQSHTPDSSRIPYPQAEGTKYRFADYYALKLLSATQVSDTYKQVIDRLIAAGSGYLIVYKNGVTLTGADINTLVYSPRAAIQQYVKARGYRLELQNSYSTFEDFVYISCTVKSLA